LILVADESSLPPLEMESEFEDYVVCGAEMDVAERVEEEILLSLPPHAVTRFAVAESAAPHEVAGRSKKPLALGSLEAEGETKKISPFAKLVALKKK
ncbi:MAG: hypothetical protein ABL931_13670, partial [Usitatibacteraceae bacterium]